MNHTKIIQWTYWIGLSLLLILLHGKHELNSDEGYVLEAAWEILNGRVLYIDSGMIVAPGSFYLIAWAWKIFGTSYYVAKIMGITSILLTSVAIYCISRLLSNKNNVFSFVAPLAFCLASAYWAVISYHTFNIVLLAWATYFFLKAISNNSLHYIAISGLFTGISILILQHVGAAFFFATLLFFLISYNKENKHFWIRGVTIYSLFSLIPLAVLFFWPIQVILDSLIFFQKLKFIKGNSTSFIPLIFTAWIVMLHFIKLRNGITKEMKFIFITQIALLATTLVRPDIGNTTILMFPVLSMTAITYATLVSSPSPILIRYTYAATTIIALTIPATAAILSLMSSVPFYDIFKDDARPLMQYIKENCNSFYAGPFIPGLYFEARSVNPIFYSIVMTNIYGEEQTMRASIDLQKSKPSCAITDYRLVEKFHYDLNNPIDKFIQNNYTIGYEFYGTTVYRLNHE